MPHHLGAQHALPSVPVSCDLPLSGQEGPTPPSTPRKATCPPFLGLSLVV